MTQLSEHRVPTEYGDLTVQIYHNRAEVSAPHAGLLTLYVWDDLDDIAEQVVAILDDHFTSLLNEKPEILLTVHRGDITDATPKFYDSEDDDATYADASLEVVYSRARDTFKFYPGLGLVDEYVAVIPMLVAVHKDTGEVYPYTARENKDAIPNFGDAPDWVINKVYQDYERSHEHDWDLIVY